MVLNSKKISQKVKKSQLIIELFLKHGKIKMLQIGMFHIRRLRNTLKTELFDLFKKV